MKQVEDIQGRVAVPVVSSVGGMAELLYGIELTSWRFEGSDIVSAVGKGPDSPGAKRSALSDSATNFRPEGDVWDILGAKTFEGGTLCLSVEVGTPVSSTKDVDSVRSFEMKDGRGSSNS